MRQSKHSKISPRTSFSKTKTLASWTLLFFLSMMFQGPSWPQEESLIQTVLDAKESFVTIKSVNTEIGPSKASAAIDPRTRHLYVAQRAPAANFEKTGAGVIIDANGIIATNLHVIAFAKKTAVVLHDNTVVGAKIIRYVPEDDLALLKIDPPYPLKAIAIADSDQIQLGEEVINVGNSKLLTHTISGGRITRIGTTGDENNKHVELIQVNMNLYKGDSGGPLLDKQGRLLGMIVAKYKSQDKATLAIPSNKIKKLYNNLPK